MKYRLFLAGFVVLASATGSVLAADEADAIRQSAAAFTAAFDRGDAKAVAALWTENGELIDEAGRTYRGRPAIEAAYAKFFAAHPGAKIKVSPGDVRVLGASAAIEEGTATLDPAPADAADPARYTAMHVKQNGKWLMASVREAPTARASAAQALADLDWLVGTWTGEEHGAKSEVQCRWLPNKSYLERAYKVTASDGTTTEGIQMIGVNPRTGQVVAWGFGYDGGHTVGAWVPRPNGWGIDAAGVMPDGTLTRAMNILTRLDDNAYSWQSVGRSVGGQSRPDTDEIVLKRSEAKKK